MLINTFEAKTHLSNLLERALQGEEIIIAKAGKPVVRLVCVVPTGKRILGSAAGTIEYAADWDAPMTAAGLGKFVGE